MTTTTNTIGGANYAPSNSSHTLRSSTANATTNSNANNRTLPFNYNNNNNNTSCIDYSNTHYNSDWTMRHAANSLEKPQSFSNVNPTVIPIIQHQQQMTANNTPTNFGSVHGIVNGGASNINNNNTNNNTNNNNNNHSNFTSFSSMKVR